MEIARLRGDVERARLEVQELALEAEKARIQAEEEARRCTLRLAEQLEDLQSRQEVKVCGEYRAGYY